MSPDILIALGFTIMTFAFALFLQGWAWLGFEMKKIAGYAIAMGLILFGLAAALIFKTILYPQLVTAEIIKSWEILFVLLWVGLMIYLYIYIFFWHIKHKQVSESTIPTETKNIYSLFHITIKFPKS